jgi:hypothetical protein
MNIKALLHLPSSLSDYRYAWIASFVISVVITPYILAFKDSAPWLIAVPLSIGAVIIVFVELRSQHLFSDDTSSHLVTMPEGYKGLREYQNLLTLDVRPRKKSSKNQLPLFPGFDDPTPSNSLRILKDKDGNEIPTIPCDRFSALLIAYLMDNADNATDKGLQTALLRFKTMGESSVAIERFLKDKVLRDIIKSDVRGNLLTQIGKGGEKVVRDLLKTIEDSGEKESAKSGKLGQ